MKKCKQNALWAMQVYRNGVRKCVVCKEEFKPVRSDSKARTCCKSCAATWRESSGENRKLYRARHKSFMNEGYTY